MKRMFWLLLVGAMNWWVLPAWAGGEVHSPSVSEGDAVHGVASDEAHGQGPGLLSPDLGTAVWTIVLFVVLVAVLGRFVWPSVLKGLQDRENKIRQDLEDAQAAVRQADETLQQYQTRLAKAQAEAKVIVDQSRTDAEKVGQQIKGDVQRQIDQMRQRATGEIRAAKEQAVHEVYQQVAALSTNIASRILHREIRPEDQQQLIDVSLDELRAKSN